MDAQDYPATRDLVLVGGGHCHALVLRAWGMRPLPGVRITLIDPNPTAPYTGMLPGLIAGHYGARDLQIDLVRLARFAGARLVLGPAVAIDRVARQVEVPGRPPVGYDLVSLDVGITSAMPDLPGFAEHGVAAKPLGQFAARWETYLARRDAGDGIVILGGGLAGVELAMAMHERLRRAGRAEEITILEAAERPLGGIGGSARDVLLREVAARGIRVLAGVRALAVEAGRVVLAGGRALSAGFVLGAAGARPPDLLRQTGLALEQGYVAVGPDLRSLNDPQVFAVGDCAHLTFAPRPKAGVFAVRQAPILLHNLQAALQGRPLRQFAPQRDYLKLVSLGGKRAVADKLGFRAGGRWVWWVKDRIDRRFMATFSEYPQPPQTPTPSAAALGLPEMLRQKPLCGACGAKVGRADLMAGLAGVMGLARPDVLSGPGDDAAILRHGRGIQVITTDHLRAVTDDPVLMARIAAIHALGDIWAMGAKPQVALSQITLPRMSPALQVRTLAEINAAAQAIFAAEGAAIVGGHTTMGAETVIGFTVTGLMQGVPLRKVGGLPGDRLVLTKSIGIGVILAADMAGAADGADVARAWDQMIRPQGMAAVILRARARAMTDVTGFGLAGHLSEMLVADLDAELDLASIPILPGALALAEGRLRSSIYPANRAAVRVAGEAESAVADLLFDPQTCGGLLAAIPPECVTEIAARFAAAGLPCHIIGSLRSGAGIIRLQPGQAGA